MTTYAARIAELEAEGLTTSDAQGVADAEILTGELAEDRCQSPYGYCAEQASHIVTVLEPGMHMPPADLRLCQWHAAAMIDAGEAEGQDVIR